MVVAPNDLEPAGGERASLADDLSDGEQVFLDSRQQAHLELHRVVSKKGRVLAQDGNGCIERFFKTLKEQLLWVRHFRSIPELFHALQEFRALYNRSWLIERLGFQSPVQARERLALEPAA